MNHKNPWVRARKLRLTRRPPAGFERVLPVDLALLEKFAEGSFDLKPERILFLVTLFCGKREFQWSQLKTEEECAQINRFVSTNMGHAMRFVKKNLPRWRREVQNGKIWIRSEPLAKREPTKAVILEPEVNFFVAMLEQLGARTCWSCGGHLNSRWYITFIAKESLVRKLHAAFPAFDYGLDFVPNRYIVEMICGTKHEKEKKLQEAATAWEEVFGPLRWHEIR